MWAELETVNFVFVPLKHVYLLLQVSLVPKTDRAVCTTRHDQVLVKAVEVKSKDL